MTPISRRLALAQLALAALLAACSPQTDQQPAALPEPFRGVNLTGSPKYGKDFHLPDADGKERSLADFKGKAVLLYFGFVQCPDICPTSLLRAAEVKKMLGKDGERLQVIFVPVDPERDTPEVLRAYMNAFDPSFIALRGSSEQLAKVADRTDILLWDLTDERLGVIEAAPECFLTRSTEGMTARLYEWAGDRLLELGTDGHLHQWERALPRFRAVLERCGLLERTVLLNAPWALRTAAGEPTVSSWGLTAQEANCMIAEYVEEVCKELPVPVLRVPDELVVADTRHRWGAAPFHYAPGLYEWVADAVEARRGAQ